MPVYLRVGSSNRGLVAVSKHSSSVDFQESSAKCINIGLINNMPDGALLATERQFFSLLNSAAGEIAVRLSPYFIPSLPRSNVSLRHLRSGYFDVDDLPNNHLDGLIVTGAEPRARNLQDEPYWNSLTGVLDWAEHNTYSSIWSCLAAHAALLAMDGIERRRLANKCFGVFDCAVTSDHQLTVGHRPSLQVPHSRWNDIAESDLVECGYRILLRTGSAGVDTFVKKRKSLVVLFQGHPEYDTSALLLEYRRDVGRYLRRERHTYPPMPQCYFGPETTCALMELQERALSDRRHELLAEFPSVMAENEIENSWRSAAVRTYSNWLEYLVRQKERRLKERPSAILSAGPFVSRSGRRPLSAH